MDGDAGRPEPLGDLGQGPRPIDQLHRDRRALDERQAGGPEDGPSGLVVLRLEDGVPDRPGAAGGTVDDVHTPLGQCPCKLGEGAGTILELDDELGTHGSLLGRSIVPLLPSSQGPIVVSHGAGTIPDVTVAAVILAASPDSALADAAGVARVRRIADAAWAGGATPIVIVAPGMDGRVAAALAGAPVTLAAPAPLADGPVAQIARGIDVALGENSGTDAVLVWPARFCWAGPETATSLIEAHGADPDSLLRPTWQGEAGWPVLVPVAALPAARALTLGAVPDDLVEALVADGTAAVRTLDLGDPGTVIDGGTSRDRLPQYDGPAQPAAQHSHEWGAAAAATSDDAPLAGPPVARPDPA